MSEQQIPGVPEGYRLKGLYRGGQIRGGEWCLDEHGTIFSFNPMYGLGFEDKLLPVLERIEPPKKYEAVITLDLTDELMQHLADTGGIWISSGDRDAFDVDRSSIKIREKGATS